MHLLDTYYIPGVKCSSLPGTHTLVREADLSQLWSIYISGYFNHRIKHRVLWEQKEGICNSLEVGPWGWWERLPGGGNSWPELLNMVRSEEQDRAEESRRFPLPVETDTWPAGRPAWEIRVHASPRVLNVEVGKQNCCTFMNLCSFLPSLCGKAHFLVTLPSKDIYTRSRKRLRFHFQFCP